MNDYIENFILIGYNFYSILGDEKIFNCDYDEFQYNSLKKAIIKIFEKINGKDKKQFEELFLIYKKDQELLNINFLEKNVFFVKKIKQLFNDGFFFNEQNLLFFTIAFLLDHPKRNFINTIEVFYFSEISEIGIFGLFSKKFLISFFKQYYGPIEISNSKYILKREKRKKEVRSFNYDFHYNIGTMVTLTIGLFFSEYFDFFITPENSEIVLKKYFGTILNSFFNTRNGIGKFSISKIKKELKWSDETIKKILLNKSIYSKHHFYEYKRGGSFSEKFKRQLFSDLDYLSEFINVTKDLLNDDNLLILNQTFSKDLPVQLKFNICIHNPKNILWLEKEYLSNNLINLCIKKINRLIKYFEFYDKNFEDIKVYNYKRLINKIKKLKF